MNRRETLKNILWALFAVGVVTTLFRLYMGLGSSTGLTDSTPWGMWIGIKLATVAFSGCGFVMAALVYVFHQEQYRPLLRRSILMGFLGYATFAVALIFDLGLPWNIWYPTVYWQHHSVLFEVAWCVMLYLTVLLLEFAPAALQHSFFDRPLFRSIDRLLHRVTLPLVIAGIVLSTLHQSSLGSLFLIMPLKLGPLFYSPWIPVIFFVTAIGLGLLAVVLESLISGYYFARKPRMELLPSLALAGAVVLWVYLALRLGDLAVRGKLLDAFDGSWRSTIFLIEVLIGAALPAALLMFRSIRHSQAGLATAAALAVFGITVQRMSVSVVGIARGPGDTYIPTFPEIALTVGLYAGTAIVFLFCVEHFPVFWGERGPEPAAKPEPSGRGFQFDPASRVYVDDSLRMVVARRGAVFLVAASITVAALPSWASRRQLTPPTPVRSALGWGSLQIDGDRNGNGVMFDHTEHKERLAETYGEEEGCRQCHHLSLPNDGPSSCAECHSDMYSTVSVFDHEGHQVRLGSARSCTECHPNPDTKKENIACSECHPHMVPEDGRNEFDCQAAGYLDALHGLCLECHRESAEEAERPELPLCGTCHTGSAAPGPRDHGQAEWVRD